MTPSLSPRDRRALVGGMITVALLAGARPLVSSAARWTMNTREETAALAAELATAQASVQGAAIARDSLVARRLRLATLDTMLFEAATAGLAAAMLAERLSDAAQSSTAICNFAATRRGRELSFRSRCRHPSPAIGPGSRAF